MNLNKISTNKNNIQSSNENVALCVVEKLWKTLDIKCENSIDLFNNNIYDGLTKKGKEKFKKYILPHLKLKAYNLAALKLLDNENILSNKKDINENNLIFNINKLKRVANENDVSLLLNLNDTNLLNKKKKKKKVGMLIISKKTFINIIKEKISIENTLLDPDNYILDTLLEMSKNKKYFFINKEKQQNLDKFKLYRYYDYPFEQRLNNAYSKVGNYIIKKNSQKNDNNNYDEIGNILKKSDYELMEKENMLNKIIHESILQVSKKNKSNLIRDESNQIKNDFENNNLYNNVNRKKYVYREKLLKRKEKKCKDPLYILKKILEKDKKDINYKQNVIMQELQECTFQPNVYKYLNYEKNNIITQKKQKNIMDKFKKENYVIEKIFNNNTDSIIAKEVHGHILKQTTKKHYNTTNENINYFNSHFLDYMNNHRKINRKHEHPTHRECRNARRNGPNGYNNKINSRMIEINYENNWNNQVRLIGRGLKAKIVPNFNLSQKTNNMNIHTNNEHLSDKMVTYHQNCNRNKKMANSTSIKSNNKNGTSYNVGKNGASYNVGKNGASYNVGKNGASYNVGKNGASYNVGKNGASYNVGKNGASYNVGKNDISYSVSKNDFMKSIMFNSINFIEPKTPKIIAVENKNEHLEQIEKLLLSLPQKFYFASMC
ncbi:conserved Plasmodium protein, unknown function [Plasmodium yoelii]|uniref:Uncharacterized protein n=1 Tax=Plasmodium yoelii TaxID=5861 RepID=A0A4V0KQY2_PLAYE|nr:conserved Plasmodium protein, unknown function [Plasmodium yoelii]VTZ80514.1 conserved Plasmodium protein, unknown function [Plasmodium yoelii]|eukprot:XP_022813522.2 conserved Plasmodium protein, unknown function [Plasmodium yoelii]